MNLKEQITRTENLEIKLQKGITNINDIIVRGGGVQSTSIAEITDNIKSMLKQYNKVAIINNEITLSNINNNTSNNYNNNLAKNTVSINLDFVPKIIIVSLKNNVSGDGTYRENVVSNINNSPDTPTNGRVCAWIKKESINKEKFDIYVHWTEPKMVPRIKQIICIS